MPVRSVLMALIVLSATGCSFSHTVRVENISDAPVTISYKLERPFNLRSGMFADRPVILRKVGKQFQPDTSIAMNASDSVVIFTLAPGDRTTIGWCMNCTMESSLQPGAVDPWTERGRTRVNISWLRIEHGGWAQTYTPHDLLDIATKKKLHQTLFRIEGA